MIWWPESQPPPAEVCDARQRYAVPPVNDTGLFEEITLPAMSPESFHWTYWPALSV